MRIIVKDWTAKHAVGYWNVLIFAIYNTLKCKNNNIDGWSPFDSPC